MAELSARNRDGLKDGDFAYIDRDGGRHLPIHDEEHFRSALARWGGTRFHSAHAKERARLIIVHTAQQYGIEVTESYEERRAA